MDILNVACFNGIDKDTALVGIKAVTTKTTTVQYRDDIKSVSGKKTVSVGQLELNEYVCFSSFCVTSGDTNMVKSSLGLSIPSVAVPV